MEALVAAGLATTISIGVSLTDKYLLGRLPGRAILTVVAFFGFMTLLLLPITGTAWPETRYALMGLGLGALFATLIICAFKAIAQEEISRLAPLSVFSTMAIIAGGIVFYNEPFTVLRGVAFAMLLTGAVLLATRFERRIEILEPEFYPRLARRAKWHVLTAVHEPFDHAERIGKRMNAAITGAARHAAHTMTHVKPMLIFRTKSKFKLVRGFWWYAAAVSLAIPLSLGNKYLSSTIGPLPGLVTIRVGMALVLTLYILTGLRESAVLWQRPRVTIIALFKEPFGITAGFLIGFALANAELSLVRSITSLEAAGIFLVSALLARMGIIAESLRRRDLVQKGLGALCMVIGSALLFR